jgi:hypothetical protein
LRACEIESELRNRLIKNDFIRAWYRDVEADYTANPFTPAELESAGAKYRSRYEKGQDRHKAYGTTLIAAAITQEYWFGIHIGDGRLTALYGDGSFDQPVPWDDRCFLNRTASICDDDAAERARVYVSLHTERAPPVAVFLCSDGVDDNYPIWQNEQHLFKIYRIIALTFAEDGFDSTCGQLKDLAASFAANGKGDDTSIAGFIDMDAAARAAAVWREQIAAEEKAERPSQAGPDKPSETAGTKSAEKPKSRRRPGLMKKP